MTKITLTLEQAEVLQGAIEPVRICLPDGSIAGWVSSTMHLTPRRTDPSPEEIEEIIKRMDSPGPWHTTEEVLAHLRSLE